MPASRTDESLAAELYPSLRQLAAVIAPAEVGPDDLLQDALVAALRQGPLASLDDPAAYLARTMLNLAANHRRRFGRAHRVLVRWRGGRTAQTLDEYPSDLDDLATLSPVARAVLYLHHVEGWPFEAVAAHLAMSAATVRQTATRARRQLRTRLEED